MRIDLALKYLCLTKSRSSIKTLCAKKAIQVNGRHAKPSSTVHANDDVTLEFPSRKLTIRLLDIPEKQLSKATAPTYYEVVADELLDDD